MTKVFNCVKLVKNIRANKNDFSGKYEGKFEDNTRKYERLKKN